MRRFHALVVALGGLATLAGVPAVARADVSPAPNLPAGQTIDEDLVPAPQQRPRDLVVPVGPATGPIPAAVNSNIIYLNNCEPGGCTITRGNTDATSNTSDIAQGSLSAFNGDAAEWADVVKCMREVYVPFNVVITDTKPTTGAYFEIMVAGTSTELGMSSSIGGVADLMCSRPGQCRGTYLPNGLVFDFANESFYAGNANEICATAAQEIAHDFCLDHVVDNTDPMTYNEGFNGVRTYHNGEVCGSDCISGKSPTGQTCTGSSDSTATHPCLGANATGATQDEIAVILALFGAGTPTPPTVTITAPHTGGYVAAGDPIQVTAADAIEVSTVALAVDGTTSLTLSSGPFAFNVPSTISLGAHTLKVTATDSITMLNASASVDVTVASACTKPADCPNNTDTCVAGHCEPGSGVQGGLGTACTADGMCASGQCGADGTGTMYCVDDCDPTAANSCPSSFQCLTATSGGVCWPESGGGGGCDAGGSGAPLGLGLGFAAWLIARRRR